VSVYAAAPFYVYTLYDQANFCHAKKAGKLNECAHVVLVKVICNEHDFRGGVFGLLDLYGPLDLWTCHSPPPPTHAHHVTPRPGLGHLKKSWLASMAKLEGEVFFFFKFIF
jgi:hypothetical protein